LKQSAAQKLAISIETWVQRLAAKKNSPLPRQARGITNKTTKNAVIHIKTPQYSGFYYYGY